MFTDRLLHRGWTLTNRNFVKNSSKFAQSFENCVLYMKIGVEKRVVKHRSKSFSVCRTVCVVHGLVASGRRNKIKYFSKPIETNGIVCNLAVWRGCVLFGWKGRFRVCPLLGTCVIVSGGNGGNQNSFSKLIHKYTIHVCNL